MKEGYFLAGAIGLLAMMMVASASIVGAQVILWARPRLDIKANGKVWFVSTNDLTEYGPDHPEPTMSFDARDVIDEMVEAKCWVDAAEPVYIDLYPSKILKFKNRFLLLFSLADLPAGEWDYSWVAAYTLHGVQLEVTGEGFTSK